MKTEHSSPAVPAGATFGSFLRLFLVLIGALFPSVSANADELPVIVGPTIPDVIPDIGPEKPNVPFWAKTANYPENINGAFLFFNAGRFWGRDVSHSTLIYSDNNGRTWTRRTVPSTLGNYYANIIWTGSVFLAFSGNEVWQSTDNGVTWSIKTTLPNALFFLSESQSNVFAVNGREIVIVVGDFAQQNPNNYNNYQYTTVRSTDHGATWTRQSHTFYARPAVFYTGGKFVAIDRDGSPRHAVWLNGNTWQSLLSYPSPTVSIPGDDYVRGILANGGGVWVYIGNKHFWRSTDNGATWTLTAKIPDPNPSQSNPYYSFYTESGDSAVIHYVNGRFVAMMYNTVYISDDGGQTWYYGPTGPQNAYIKITFAYGNGTFLTAPLSPSPPTHPTAFYALSFNRVQASTTDGPEWWDAYQALTPDVPPQNNAAVTVGQIKNLAYKAAQGMNARFVGGAGPAVNALVDGWLAPPPPGVKRRNNAVATVGQLKATALPFYQRLEEVGICAPENYPWALTSKTPANAAPATIGQTKYMFSFEIPEGIAPVDTDGDGIPDYWEKIIGSNPYAADAYAYEHNRYGETNFELYQEALAKNAANYGSTNNNTSDPPPSPDPAPADGTPAPSDPPDLSRAACPFYAVVDLGIAESGLQRDNLRFENFLEYPTAISEKNGWLVSSHFRRWRNGEWSNLQWPLGRTTSNGTYQPWSISHFTTPDIGDIGSVVSTLRSSDFEYGNVSGGGNYNPTSTTQDIRNGFYWNSAGQFTATPLVPSGYGIDNYAHRAWGLKMLDPETNQHPQFPFYAIEGNMLDSFYEYIWTAIPTFINREGDKLMFGNSVFYKNGISNVNPVCNPASADETYPNTTLTSINRERYSVGTRDRGDVHTPIITHTGGIFNLPCRDEKVEGLPIHINAPKGIRAGYYTIASKDHIWYRKTEKTTGKLPNADFRELLRTDEAFYKPQHVSNFMTSGNWIKWGITTGNDAGFLAGTATDSTNNTVHNLLLVPGNYVQGELGTDTEEIGNCTSGEAVPSPEVAITEIDGEVIGGQVAITLGGKVTDLISKYAANDSEKLRTIEIFVNDELLATWELQGDVATEAYFSGTVTVDIPETERFFIKAKTTRNVSQQKGWAAAIITVMYLFSEPPEEDPPPSDPTGGNGNEFRIAPGEFVLGTKGIIGSKPTQGDEKPFTVRLAYLPEWENNPNVRILAGNQPYPLKAFTYNDETHLYPYDERWPEEPKMFLASRYSVPQKLETPGYVPGSGSYEFKLRMGGTDNPFLTYVIEENYDQYEETTTPSGVHSGATAMSMTMPMATQSQDATNDNDDISDSYTLPPEITPENIIETYNFFFDHTNDKAPEKEFFVRYLERLLVNARKNKLPALVIKTDNLSFLTGSYDADYNRRRDADYNWSRTLTVTFDNSKKRRAVDCAKTLHKILLSSIVEERGVFLKLAESIRNEMLLERKNSMQFDKIVKFYAQLNNAILNDAQELIDSGAKIFEAGYRIACTPADVVISTGEVIQGDTSALMGVIPFAGGFVKHGKKIVKVATRAKSMRITSIDQLEAIKYVNDNIKGTMKQFSERYNHLVVKNKLSPELFELLVLDGRIEITKSRRILKNNMEKANKYKPKDVSVHAHHDLPWQFNKQFSAKGFDINNAKYGRWAEIDVHQVWHHEEHIVRFRNKKVAKVNFNEAWNLFLNNKKYGGKNFSDMTPEDIGISKNYA